MLLQKSSARCYYSFGAVLSLAWSSLLQKNWVSIIASRFRRMDLYAAYYYLDLIRSLQHLGSIKEASASNIEADGLNCSSDNCLAY